MLIDEEDRDCAFYRLMDRDTGRLISHWVWADDEAGAYGVARLNKSGTPDVLPGLGITVDVKRGNIKLLDVRAHPGLQHWGRYAN